MAAPMADKLPALQFYPGDWRKDVGVQSLRLAARIEGRND